MVDGVPGDDADGLPAGLNDQSAVVLAQEAVGLEPAAHAADVAKAPPVGLAAHLAIDGPALQELEVSPSHRPQGYPCLRCGHGCRVEGTRSAQAWSRSAPDRAPCPRHVLTRGCQRQHRSTPGRAGRWWLGRRPRGHPRCAQEHTPRPRASYVQRPSWRTGAAVPLGRPAQIPAWCLQPLSCYAGARAARPRAGGWSRGCQS